MKIETKTYTECKLCGFRKWCKTETVTVKGQPPKTRYICLACERFGVNPRFTKDKCK